MTVPTRFEDGMAHLGDRVRDKITGIEGVVIARTEWLYGCLRVSVQPSSTDGKQPDVFTVDDPQLEVLEAGVFTLPAATAPAGELVRTHGDRPDPGRASAPR
jgi:hypothetical protein